MSNIRNKKLSGEAAALRGDSLIQFRWAVHEGGYRFVKAPDLKGINRRWMVEARSPYGGPWVRRTFPLAESPALFREFADLDSEEASIVRFADEHGALTRERLPAPRPGRGRTPCPGEGLRLWRDEVRWMRGVIELLDAAALSDERQLKRWVRFERGRVRYQTPWIRGSLPLSAEHSKDLQSGDRVGAAPFIAQRTINKRLEERTRAALLHHADATTFAVHLVPIDLLGALWLQCALGLGREQNYRQCWQCGTWMEIVPARGRRDRIYCSSRCRQEAYRRRKKKTHESRRRR